MKVAIIGAGISGLYLAWKLAEKGHQVTVFEKKEKIGKEVCSGLFSERILEFIPESRKLIENQIDYCLIRFPKRTIKINFSKKFLVINHLELDELVADLAEKAGARIILNKEIKREDIFKLKNEFKRIIGCDGAISVIRKSLNLLEPNYRLGILGFSSKNSSPDLRQTAKFLEQNFVETWPTKFGFLWKIPRKNVVEYGIFEKPNRAKEIFEKFLKKNNLQLEVLKSALIPQTPTLKFSWWGKGLIIPKNSKITLCGDAASLTKPWSGGGVVWSLTAANLLLKNFPDFIKYQKAVKKFFLTKIIFSKITTKIVYFLGFNFPWILPKNIQIESDFLI